MVGFERPHAHGALPDSAHLEWPFLSDGHRHLAQALHAWLDSQTGDATTDWGVALRAAGWPGLAADGRGRAVLAEALAAHHADAVPAAQALFAPAAALGAARRIARLWRLALTPDQQEQAATLECLGRLEASLEAAALGVYRAAWQLDRHANDPAIDEAAAGLAALMVNALLHDLLDALATLPTPGSGAWQTALREALAGDGPPSQATAQAVAQRVGRWRLQHP
jgi:hypothetical protein